MCIGGSTYRLCSRGTGNQTDGFACSCGPEEEGFPNERNLPWIRFGCPFFGVRKATFVGQRRRLRHAGPFGSPPGPRAGNPLLDYGADRASVV